MADGAAGKPKAGGILGSLKDALAAASRDDTHAAAHAGARPATPESNEASESLVGDAGSPPGPLSAADAARLARGTGSLTPSIPIQERHMEFDGTNTTRIVRGGAAKPAAPIATGEGDEARTQLVRGRQPLKRGQFAQDPVVGWLVITGGPGLGAYRPVFEGNNTVGRSANSRIPLDFGDDSISSEEQAYIRYDSNDRGFLFVPNMSKTNVVSVNQKRPTSAIPLVAMDVIVMGRTQLVFMPFCGSEFDWADIAESKD